MDKVSTKVSNTGQINIASVGPSGPTPVERMSICQSPGIDTSQRISMCRSTRTDSLERVNCSFSTFLHARQTLLDSPQFSREYFILSSPSSPPNTDNDIEPTDTGLRLDVCTREDKTSASWKRKIRRSISFRVKIGREIGGVYRGVSGSHEERGTC